MDSSGVSPTLTPPPPHKSFYLSAGLNPPLSQGGRGQCNDWGRVTMSQRLCKSPSPDNFSLRFLCVLIYIYVYIQYVYIQYVYIYIHTYREIHSMQFLAVFSYMTSAASITPTTVSLHSPLSALPIIAQLRHPYRLALKIHNL